MKNLFLFFFLVVLGVSMNAQAPSDKQVSFSTGDGDGPVILLDGKEISQNEFAKFGTENIGDIKILSGADAYKEFGKYKNSGVIVVKSLDNAPSEMTVVEETTVGEEKVVEDVKHSFDADFAGLVIINGAPSTIEALRAMQPSKIKTLKLYYGDEATALFGDKAVDGAMIVETNK